MIRAATVHSAVAAVRKRAGWTQRQLGALVGVSRQTVVELEAGGYNPSTALALRLAVVLDVPVHKLFALSEDEVRTLRVRRERLDKEGLHR